MLERNKPIPIMVCLLIGLIFVLLSTVRLGAQGAYYDELFQATSSFSYLGHDFDKFMVLKIHGIPIMNMSYVGAVKSALYGIYLRLSGLGFSIISWRLLGIICVALGIVGFGFLVRKRLPLSAFLIFFFLFITDLTVLLTTRFDWGPVALTLSLHLLLIGLWLVGVFSPKVRLPGTFLMGAIVGISIFIKLSEMVLLTPLLLMFIINPLRRLPAQLGALLVGGLVGGSPLIVANLWSYSHQGYLISLQLQGVLQRPAISLPGFLSTVKEYLSLGSGVRVQQFILGQSHPAFYLIEGILIGLLLVILVIGLIKHATSLSLYFRLSGIMLLAYLSMIIGLYFLPAHTSDHHWVHATPFLYTALALFFIGLREDHSVKRLSWDRLAFILPLSILFITRLVGLAFLEQSFVRGDASAKWDPSLTAIGQFAARQSSDVIFIAADWGVANQLICFRNGNPGVYELYANDQVNVNLILQIMRDTQKPDVYLVFHQPGYFVTLDDRNRLLDEISQSLAWKWHAQPLESAIQGLKSVTIFKFSQTASINSP